MPLSLDGHMTIDQLIASLTEIKERSPRGGATIVLACKPGDFWRRIEYCEPQIWDDEPVAELEIGSEA